MGDGEKPPRVILRHDNVYCPYHLERFRERWPEAFAPAVILMFAAFVRLPQVVDYAHGNTDALNAALAEFGPICSQLPVALVDEIADVSLSGDMAAFDQLRARIESTT